MEMLFLYVGVDAGEVLTVFNNNAFIAHTTKSFNQDAHERPNGPLPRLWH